VGTKVQKKTKTKSKKKKKRENAFKKNIKINK
jgi:hypothetical protein